MGEEQFDVLNLDEEQVCKLSIKTDLEDYTECFALVREPIKKSNILNIAEAIVNTITRDSDIAGSGEYECIIAFPYCNGFAMVLNFTGKNLDYASEAVLRQSVIKLMYCMQRNYVELIGRSGDLAEEMRSNLTELKSIVAPYMDDSITYVAEN